MIDQTTSRIYEARVANRRRKQHQQRFERLVALTDTVLWQLEEMNRDGVAVMPERRRQVIESKIADLPDPLRGMFCADGTVQAALDSLFEMQQAIFKARHPEFDFGEAEELEAD
jgi:hypothetical protein